MKNKTAAFHNLGCKVNAYEMEGMEESLRNAGYTIVPFTEKADVYVINTCTVTRVADQKSRQMISRAKTLNPDAIVVACGCYANTGKDVLIKDGVADIILGNNEKSQLNAEIEKLRTARLSDKNARETFGSNIVTHGKKEPLIKRLFNAFSILLLRSFLCSPLYQLSQISFGRRPEKKTLLQ